MAQKNKILKYKYNKVCAEFVCWKLKLKLTLIKELKEDLNKWIGWLEDSILLRC